MFWLVTWNTYGSWLPGDPRGFRTFRGQEYVPPPELFARNGEEIYNPADYEQRFRWSHVLTPNAVALSETEKQLARDAFIAEIESLPLNPLILAVSRQHSHLIAQFGSLLIRPTVGRLKAAATRAVPNPGDRKRIWAVDCHMESLKGGEAVQNAYNYVRRHEEERALIHDWTYKPKRR